MISILSSPSSSNEMTKWDSRGMASTTGTHQTPPAPTYSGWQMEAHLQPNATSIVSDTIRQEINTVCMKKKHAMHLECGKFEQPLTQENHIIEK